MQRTQAEEAEFQAWQRAVAAMRRRPKPTPPRDKGYHPHIGHRPHDTVARRIEEGDPHAARRVCLHCDCSFLSEGPWNRICPICKGQQYRMPAERGPTARYEPPRYKETLQC